MNPGKRDLPSLAPEASRQPHVLANRFGALAEAHPLASLAKSMLDPVVIVITLYGLALYYRIGRDSVLELLAILSFLLASLILDNTLLLLVESRSHWLGLGKMVCSWLWLTLLILAVCAVAGLLQVFPRNFLTVWLVLAWVLCLLAHAAFRLLIMRPSQGKDGLRRVLIVGTTASGLMLAQRIASNTQLGLRLIGFVEDRAETRLPQVPPGKVLGQIGALVRIVQQQQIHRVYVSLPMSSQDRILDLTEALKDSTASLYFVPDLSIFDLIQARVDHLAGLPVLVVCDSPFVGLNKFIKRSEDLLLASLILLLIWPLLLLLALAVKLTSPGPVIFVQRRYGIDGQSIEVFKFRSMTVMEDGETSLQQAHKGDARLSPIGAFIRRTSLDELPQFFNVLLGSMSIVGPRPHPFALNELYRSQIRGYMQRHKVKPGITGWAQVNGCRGETAGVEPMRRRIEFDLDYLRNWSLWGDLKIVLLTVWVVLRDPNAY